MEAWAPVWTLAKAAAGSLPDNSWLQAFLLTGAVVLGGYVVGHVVASVSTLLVERLLVSKGYGWPVNQLLNRDRPEEDESRKFYRGLFAWANAYLLLRYMKQPMEVPYASALLLFMESILLVLLVGKVLTWAVHWKLVDAIIHYICIPYDWAARMLARVLGTRDALPEAVIRVFEQKFDAIAPIKLTDLGNESTATYWFPYLFLQHRAPYLLPTLAHWRTLYVFCRNLSTALYLAAAYLAFGISAQVGSVHSESVSHASIVLWSPLVLYFAAMLMLLRYYYLFSCRYTRLVIRGFLYASGPLGSAPPEMASRVTLAEQA